MGKAAEYTLVSYTLGGMVKTALISHETLREYKVAECLSPHAEEIEERGVVQIVGDTDYLGEIYTED